MTPDPRRVTGMTDSRRPSAPRASAVRIRDTGSPVGGEALQHTADAVFLLEEMSLGSKEIAELWGGAYRDKIDIIRAVKSVTTPTFPHPIRVDRDPASGVLTQHALQPASMKPLPVK